MDTSHTESAALFDAELWFKENSRNAPSLKQETIKVVAGFTLLWNLFEDCICDNYAKLRAFKNIISNLEYLPKLEKSINESLSFYQNRYVEGQNTNYLFEELYFQEREENWKEHVKAVLKGEIAGIYDKTLALLLVAYRIRNNLFHGLKSVESWDDQAKNISEASRILSIVIEAKGIDILKRKRYLTIDDLSPKN
jgi:hypothetical protein